MSGSGQLFHADHPRRLVPELSVNAAKAGWFVGIGAGGFFSIKQGYVKKDGYILIETLFQSYFEGFYT